MEYRKIKNIKELIGEAWEYKGRNCLLELERLEEGEDGVGLVLCLYIKNLGSLERDFDSSEPYSNFIYSDNTYIFIAEYNLKILEFFGLNVEMVV